MRTSRSFKHENKTEQNSGLKFLPFRSFRLGSKFTMIAIAIVIFSLFACKDNSGAYRGKLSDCADALSKVYKEDVDKLKSYVDQDDMDSYDVALAAKKDLQEKFNAFLEIEPSKKLQDKKAEIEEKLKPVFESLDKVEAAIEVYKNSGKIESYRQAFEESFKIMNTAIDDLNEIFNGMKEKE